MNKLGFAYSYWLGQHTSTINRTLADFKINTIEEKTKPKSEIQRNNNKALKMLVSF